MKVVIIGNNYSSLLGMIRAVGQAGHEAYLVNLVKACPHFSVRSLYDTDLIPVKSKYLKKAYFSTGVDDEQGLVDLLLREFSGMGEKLALIPTDDHSTSALDRNRAQLEPYFILPSVKNGGSILQLMDKNYQKQLARECGLPVAQGCVLQQKDGKYQIPGDLIYPCITKPQLSYLGKKKFIRRCEDRAQLETVLADISEFGEFPVLVEQFMPIDKELATLGACDGEHATLPGMILVSRDGHESYKGIAIEGTVLPASEYRGLFDKLREFMHRTGLNGLFDIDLYESGGVVYFNELNTRFGGSGHAFTAMGANLPGNWLHAVEHPEEGVQEMEITRSSHFFSERVFLGDYYSGYITLSEGKALQKNAEISFIKDPEDMAPYRQFRKKYITCVAGHALRSILK